MLKLLHMMSFYWWHRQCLEDLKPEKTRKKWVNLIYDRDNLNIYLVRYYLMDTRFIENNKFLNKYFWWASFRFTIHNTILSDDDSGFHSHPWVWASLILHTGYWEDTPNGKYWRYPGHLRFRSSKSFHRLIIDENNKDEVWSLFWMGPHTQEWGFLDESTGQWVRHDIYLERRNKTLL